jgi:branched-subunit amino acid ABC-type transport system permease component
MMNGSPEEVAIRTSLVAGFTGSVVGATLGPPGAVAGGVTLGTAGYVYGYSVAKHQETRDDPGVDTA